MNQHRALPCQLSLVGEVRHHIRVDAPADVTLPQRENRNCSEPTRALVFRWMRLSPGRQESHEDCQDRKRQQQDEDRGQQALPGSEVQLVGRVAEEALREELAADDDVPAHREDADERQDTCRCVYPAPCALQQAATPASPASRTIGSSVPRQIWITMCDTKSRVWTMKSSAPNDSSAS